MYFPHPLTADQDGLLAIGGDLSEERLIFAYENGIFPWYLEPPILWWYTQPRCVLRPSELKISKSMRSLLKRKKYQLSCNQNFTKVIEYCSVIPRKDQESTWISPEMRIAFIALHQRGLAHSIEVWDNHELVGGLYGIAIGKIFFGESMFSKKPNASKYGLIHLVRCLEKAKFWLIDCQQETNHMKSMGAHMISGTDFWSYITKNRQEKRVVDFTIYCEEI